jgi:hypothetical protein
VTQKGSIPKTLIFGVLVGALLILAVASLTESSQLYSFPSSKTWFPTVHTTVNSYHTWRADPLTVLLSLALANVRTQVDPAVRILPTTQLLIFYCGIVFLLLSRSRTFVSDSITPWLVPTLMCISMMLLFGLDVVIFGSLQWAPWLTIAVGGLQTTSSFRDVVARLPIVIAVGFFTFLSVLASNQITLIVLLPILFFHRLITPMTPPNNEESSTGRAFLIARCLIVSIAVYASFSVPLADFPSYPPEALIVPDDGVPGIVRPDVGNDYPLAVINREATREILFPFSSTFLLSVVAAWGYLRLVRKEAPTGLFKLVLFWGPLLLLDSLLPEKAALQLPLGALQRVLPGSSCVPLHLLMLALLAYFSFLSITSLRRIVAPCILFIAVLTTKAASFGGSVKALYAPPYSSDTTKTVREAVYNLESAKRENFISPSLFVMQYFNYIFFPHGAVNSPEAKVLTSVSALPLKDIQIKIETTPPSSSNQIQNMFDGDATTRWSPGGGVQVGGESITLHFSTPLSFDGLQLDTGNFKTDYPRGVTISIPETCASNLSSTGVWNFPEWKGSLRFSSDDHPYFGPQSDVVIPFGATVVTSCLVIEQKGSDSHYDWSVAEMYRLVRN